MNSFEQNTPLIVLENGNIFIKSISELHKTNAANIKVWGYENWVDVESILETKTDTLLIEIITKNGFFVAGEHTIIGCSFSDMKKVKDIKIGDKINTSWNAPVSGVSQIIDVETNMNFTWYNRGSTSLNIPDEILNGKKTNQLLFFSGYNEKNSINSILSCGNELEIQKLWFLARNIGLSLAVVNINSFKKVKPCKIAPSGIVKQINYIQNIENTYTLNISNKISPVLVNIGVGELCIFLR
jgi:hypothetical protein